MTDGINNEKIDDNITKKDVDKYAAQRYARKVMPAAIVGIVSVSSCLLGIIFVAGILIIPCIVCLILAVAVICPLIKYDKRIIVFPVLASFFLHLNIISLFNVDLVWLPYIVIFSTCCLCLSAFILLLVIGSDKRKNKYILQVENEVLAGDGNNDHKQFISELNALSKAHDYDGFVKGVNLAHALYELRKDVILTEKEAQAVISKAVVDCAVTEGADAAEVLRDTCKPLYAQRDFETIRAVSETYSQKAAEYRKELVAARGGEPAFVCECGGKSTFDGSVAEFIGWSILCYLINAVTFGIAYPATLCMMMRWQASHTLYNGKRLSFDGTGMQLFGKWICWELLTVITFGIYGFFVCVKVEEWKAKHTHIAGEFAELGSAFDGRVLAMFAHNLLFVFLSMISLGLAVPAAYCIRERWLCAHRIYDGRRFGFDGSGVELFGNFIIWYLLSVVTLGIYSLWIPNRFLKWQAEHTTIVG